MSTHTDSWLDFMYQTAKSIGFEIYDENPDIEEVELSSEIYNVLMQNPSYRNYQTAVDNRSKSAAQRILSVKNIPNCKN